MDGIHAWWKDPFWQDLLFQLEETTAPQRLDRCWRCMNPITESDRPAGGARTLVCRGCRVDLELWGARRRNASPPGQPSRRRSPLPKPLW